MELLGLCTQGVDVQYVRMPTHSHTHIPTYLSVYLPTCLLTYPPTFLLAYKYVFTCVQDKMRDMLVGPPDVIHTVNADDPNDW